MNTPTAIVVTGLIIAAAVAASGWMSPRFQVASGPVHGTAWIIDTKTGRLEHVVGKDVTVVRP
jgi:hypothetical protein